MSVISNGFAFRSLFVEGKVSTENRDKSKKCLEDSAIKRGSNFFDKLALGEFEGASGTVGAVLFGILTLGTSFLFASVKREYVINDVTGEHLKGILIGELREDEELSETKKTTLGDTFTKLEPQDLKEICHIAIKVYSEVKNKALDILKNSHEIHVLWQDEDQNEQIFAHDFMLILKNKGGQLIELTTDKDSFLKFMTKVTQNDQAAIQAIVDIHLEELGQFVITGDEFNQEGEVTKSAGGTNQQKINIPHSIDGEVLVNDGRGIKVTESKDEAPKGQPLVKNQQEMNDSHKNSLSTRNSPVVENIGPKPSGSSERVKSEELKNLSFSDILTKNYRKRRFNQNSLPQ